MTLPRHAGGIFGIVLGLLCASRVHAAPEDALDAGTQIFYLKAVATEDRHQYGQAAALYRLVLGRDAGFLPASLGLGRALEGQGDRAGAEAVYRALGDEADAVEALARLVEGRDPNKALALWRRLETLRLGDATPFGQEARLLAPSDPDAALATVRRYLTLLEGAEPDGDAIRAVGVALLDAGRADQAEALWRAHIESFPASSVASELGARLDRLEIERAAQALALGGSEPLSAELLPRWSAAQEAINAGRLADAEAEGRSLVAAAPRSAVAHGLLADVLVARQQWGDAEIHSILARSLAPDEASNRVRLGLLLAEAYGGRRDREAEEELREAAVLRPADVEVLVALGRIEQRLGEWSRASNAYERALAAGAGAATSSELRALVDALARLPPAAPTVPLPAASSPPAASRTPLPPEAERAYRVAIVLHKRGRISEAITELDAALAAAPDAALLLNLRARLAHKEGSPGEEESWWRKSLAADPDQPEVLLALGDLSQTQGDRAAAARWFAEAAERGAADAHFHLAELAMSEDDWPRVRTELTAYEAGAPGRASLYAPAAAALRATVQRRLVAERLGIVLALAVGVLAPLGFWARRRSARTLRDLLDGAPESWHDAARLLAALRHEVLKHNTTVLPDVADALERGDTEPWEAFSTRSKALLEHFRRYVADLEALGRTHGLRLGLRTRDPILGPVDRALARLARSRRAPRPDELRALSEVVNREGYQAIGRIVREICVLPVNAERVLEVYARVAAEPGFSGTILPNLTVKEREPGLAVRMFRADLEDILANLLRNALAAGAGRLSVDLGAFDDPITGHAWVEVAVVDDAPGTLTNAMIRGRYIGRGLGLAVDLINKHGGAIRVEPRDEPCKAVVVQLPSVEAAPAEVEWTVA